MMRTLLAAVVVIAVGLVAVASAGQESSTARQAAPPRVEPVTVPTGDGTPVITDGFFSPGEWDDAFKILVADGVTMFLKEYRDVVFVGVRGATGPTDVRLAVPGGPILRLHVSYALGQVRVPLTGAGPALRLGFTTDWYANEIRRDEPAFQRMLKEGRNEQEALQATTHPSEGREFAIRRFKVPGRVWLMRLSASADIASTPGSISYPPSPLDSRSGRPEQNRRAAPERSTDGWLELRLK